MYVRERFTKLHRLLNLLYIIAGVDDSWALGIETIDIY